MIEITNKTRSPIQIMVRSKNKTRSFTTMMIPGMGKKKNVIIIEDEKKTDYIDRLEDKKIISTRYISNNRDGR